MSEEMFIGRKTLSFVMKLKMKSDILFCAFQIKIRGVPFMCISAANQTFPFMLGLASSL